ncbi:MAG: hypothetical protein D6763_00960 [Alphaproteobacteria bacterium]|nr:MAG: hypothetical protein D6763_00960 [Alphaproteobacteria bacterium]
MGIMTKFIKTLSLIIMCSLFAVSAEAQSKGRQFLGGFRDWDAFKEIRANGEVTCYMISVPKNTAPKNVRRGEIYVIITHWPEAQIRSQVNVVVGYPFKEGSTASAIIDGRTHKMFTQGERAWAYDDKQDQEMTEAMKRGARLVVKGTSARGTNTTDTYSLSGFTAAHNAITQACY